MTAEDRTAAVGSGADGDELAPRPALFCEKLLSALDASEGRRRKRARNTTPDAIGMAVKRDLLHGTIAEDPEPEAYEAWLYGRVMAAGAASGPVRAMALDLANEWRTVRQMPSFRAWLEHGAPSEDAAE